MESQLGESNDPAVWASGGDSRSSIVHLPWLPASFWEDLPPTPWAFLSPLMQEWTWQYDEPNTQLRRMVAALRDSRLLNWSRPDREPSCVLDDLLPRPRARGKQPADAAGRAAAMPRARRVVLATLQATRGLDVLATHEMHGLIGQARQHDLSWSSLAFVLECSRQAAQQRYRSGPATPPSLKTWDTSPLRGQFQDLITCLADNSLAGLLIGIHASGPVTWEVTYADPFEDRQLWWSEQPDDHRIVLARLPATDSIRAMSPQDREALLQLGDRPRPSRASVSRLSWRSGRDDLLSHTSWGSRPRTPRTQKAPYPDV
jgi:hypothetical protein